MFYKTQADSGPHSDTCPFGQISCESALDSDSGRYITGVRADVTTNGGSVSGKICISSPSGTPSTTCSDFTTNSNGYHGPMYLAAGPGYTHTLLWFDMPSLKCCTATWNHSIDQSGSGPTPTSPTLGCQNNACVAGGSGNACFTDPDCVPIVQPPGSGRFKCSNNTCSWAAGDSGTNQCTTNSECIAQGGNNGGGNNGGGNSSHFQCASSPDAEGYYCQNVSGPGPDTCVHDIGACAPPEPDPIVSISCQTTTMGGYQPGGPCYLISSSQTYWIAAVGLFSDPTKDYIIREDTGGSTPCCGPVAGSAMGPDPWIYPIKYTVHVFSPSGNKTAVASLLIIPPNPYTIVNVVTQGLSTGGWCLYSPSPSAPPSPLCQNGNYTNSFASPGSYKIIPVPLAGYSATVSPSDVQNGVAGGSITFTVTYTLNACSAAGSPYSIDYLVVGGGGGGGSTYQTGGGGGGGVLFDTTTITPGDSIWVALGEGGLGAQSQSNGAAANGNVDNPIYWQGQHGASSKLFGGGLSITAIGGGGSGGYYGGAPQNGGSGGGGFRGVPYGIGTPGQGNNGGYSFINTNDSYAGGGGGGAGGVGGGGIVDAGNGGPGKIVPWLGNNYKYGAGGGGTQHPTYGSSGAGGLDGGGAGGLLGGDGAIDSGGGGGGSYAYAGAGGDGSSGLVVIRYAGAQRGNWGRTSSSKDYTFHVFTSGLAGFFNNFAATTCSPPNTPTNVTATEPNYCVSGPAATIAWTYSDPSGSPQQSYQVQITETGSFNTTILDTGKIISGSNSYFTGQGVLQFNTTYKARVRVWNSQDTVSEWSGPTNSWKTPLYAYPQVDFNWTANGILNNPSPPLNKPVTFTDQTVFNDNSGGHKWDWLFGDGGSSKTQNPSYTYSAEGSYYITLTATDNGNQSCVRTKGPIIIQKPIPKWREIAPK